MENWWNDYWSFAVSFQKQQENENNNSIKIVFWSPGDTTILLKIQSSWTTHYAYLPCIYVSYGIYYKQYMYLVLVDA